MCLRGDLQPILLNLYSLNFLRCDVGDCVTLEHSLLYRIVLAIPGFLFFYVKLIIILSMSMKN